MDKSKVYYTNMRTGFNNNLLDKLKKTDPESRYRNN